MYFVIDSTQLKLQNTKALNIVYNGTEIKQYANVQYLKCILDESSSGESMTLDAIDNVNWGRKFLHRQNRFLTYPLRKLLYIALFQPLLDFYIITTFHIIAVY